MIVEFIKHRHFLNQKKDDYKLFHFFLYLFMEICWKLNVISCFYVLLIATKILLTSKLVSAVIICDAGASVLALIS